MQRKLSKNAKITLSILFLLAGILFITKPYFNNIKSNLYNKKNLELFEKITLEDEINNIEIDPIEDLPDDVSDPGLIKEEPTTVATTKPSGNKTTTQKTTKPTNVDTRDNYIGYLEVPDVNIKRGFVSPDSKYNTIGYNVTIIKGSSFPDVPRGNFILAAHRGSSKVSFFENLHKVKIGSKAYVTYNGKKYTYKLIETYELPKTGTLTLRRDGSKTALTLITCSKTNKKVQIVFNYELISVK